MVPISFNYYAKEYSDYRSIMKSIRTALKGVLIFQLRRFPDERGFFLESYNKREFAGSGITEHFVQDNHSFSHNNVLRGLHYQFERPQGKLIRAIGGEILDVVVDLRRLSPTLGQWFACRLSEENGRMIWIPRGFAHGFRVLSESVHVLYKATEFFAPETERTILWNDPTLNIDWQLDSSPIVSQKDARGMAFVEAPKFD
jgi:dTDP-4-dehydrorhamnose 3,5-epimerase